MKITRIVKNLKCDTVLCEKMADYELAVGSYKGNIFMCESCFKILQNLFKRIGSKNG